VDQEAYVVISSDIEGDLSQPGLDRLGLVAIGVTLPVRRMFEQRST